MTNNQKAQKIKKEKERAWDTSINGEPILNR